MCLGYGGVVEEWVGGVMSLCVVGLDYLCGWQVQVSVYCARQIPAHLMCTRWSILLHHGYLLNSVYSDLLACGCRTWISLDITQFYEEQCQPSSGSALPACHKYGKSGPH